MHDKNSSGEETDPAPDATGSPPTMPLETTATGTTTGAITVTGVSDDGEDFAWRSRQDVLYQSWVQLRYHKKRQMFFDRWDKATKSLTIFLGATLIGEEIKSSLTYVASTISFLSLLSLVFTYSDRKQTHKELSEAYGSLLADIEKVSPVVVKVENTADWQSRHVAIAAKAPPPLKRLTLYCAREQSLAQGAAPHPTTGWWKNSLYLFKYYV